MCESPNQTDVQCRERLDQLDECLAQIGTYSTRYGFRESSSVSANRFFGRLASSCQRVRQTPCYLPLNRVIAVFQRRKERLLYRVRWVPCYLPLNRVIAVFQLPKRAAVVVSGEK